MEITSNILRRRNSPRKFSEKIDNEIRWECNGNLLEYVNESCCITFGNYRRDTEIVAENHGIFMEITVFDAFLTWGIIGN